MLTRWDPFQEMMTLRSTVDRLFDNIFSSQSSWPLPASGGFALDVAENENGYIVKASIPGVSLDDLDITITDNVLTIKGELKEDKEVKEAQYHVRERRLGSFSRSVSIPSKVNSDAIKAEFANGVLTLSLPKTEEVKPKRISVNAETPKVIEGKLKR